jgi:hypothetical protein
MGDQAYQVTPSVATWIPPGEIEGEPHEVRDLAVQQLRAVVKAVAELTLASVVQIRNAGITGKPGRNTEEVSLDAWLASDEGQACRTLIEGARALTGGVSRL